MRSIGSGNGTSSRFEFLVSRSRSLAPVGSASGRPFCGHCDRVVALRTVA